MSSPSRSSAPPGPADGTKELGARAQRTLQRILDAGVKVFERKGYHAIRVDDIVRAARISHGTFYLYFSNKDDLFGRLAADVAGEMHRLTASFQPLRPGPEGLAELREWLGGFARIYEAYGPVIQAWTEAETWGSDVGRLGADVLAEFAATMARHVEASGADVGDPAIAGLAIVAMIERVNYYGLSRQLGVPHELVLDSVAAVVHAALFGPPGPASA